MAFNSIFQPLVEGEALQQKKKRGDKMPKGKKANGKKVGLTSAIVKKQKTRKEMNPLFEKRPKNLGSGQNIQKYHRLRQRALLL